MWFTGTGGGGSGSGKPPLKKRKFDCCFSPRRRFWGSFIYDAR